MKALDLKGQVFERLKVVRRVSQPRRTTETGMFWLCRCECGETIVVSSQRLPKGTTRSCGCLRRELVSRKYLIDLTGQVFGRLRVIKRAPKPRGLVSHQAFWRCLCTCGRVTVVVSQQLRDGHTRSCGCLLREVAADRMKKYKAAFKNDPVLQERWREKWEPSLKFNKSKAYREKQANISRENWANPGDSGTEGGWLHRHGQGDMERTSAGSNPPIMAEPGSPQKTPGSCEACRQEQTENSCCSISGQSHSH